METDELRTQLENMLDTSQEGMSDAIDEIVANMEEGEKPLGTIYPSMTPEDRVLMLQNMLDNESDWRKRAQIAARIISEKLST